MFTNKYNGMESLPLEAVEEVTKHLTPQELSACCAVSVDWRDAFNQDSLWRQHCNKDTAEYLETAECRVEPRFESPESEDSTLSPVCRWRMCYMRETHLRNNWRKWKSGDGVTSCRGFGNDHRTPNSAGTISVLCRQCGLERCLQPGQSVEATL
ncbi:uncharacterized protein LOC124355382 isoform X3 [Homalodisca vitripennis]|uniref:uncharacterized protein LOC124355382 isoform X3 n=1 Tax=Homalodisca vitripennis TaxID=197043 RepID=UPI001EEA3CBB|nr:uncharacterized protein LOC124355382 isoform X3 [Homalodisca vitripennis]